MISSPNTTELFDCSTPTRRGSPSSSPSGAEVDGPELERPSSAGTVVPARIRSTSSRERPGRRARRTRPSRRRPRRPPAPSPRRPAGSRAGAGRGRASRSGTDLDERRDQQRRLVAEQRRLEHARVRRPPRSSTPNQRRLRTYSSSASSSMKSRSPARAAPRSRVRPQLEPEEAAAREREQVRAARRCAGTRVRPNISSGTIPSNQRQVELDRLRRAREVVHAEHDVVLVAADVGEDRRGSSGVSAS